MINKENQRRKKTGIKKVEHKKKETERRKRKFRIFKDRQSRRIEKRRLNRKRKRQKRIGSEKTKIKKYVSFRKYITTKERKKMTELRSPRYICAGEISSRDPSERLQRIAKILYKS